MRLSIVILFAFLCCTHAQHPAPIFSPPWLALTPDLNRELKAHWKFDETNGTRADSISTNTLTVTGSLTNVTGIISNAVDITGGNLNRTLFVTDGIWPGLEVSMTWAGWVKFDSFTTLEQCLMSLYFPGGGGGFVIQTLATNLHLYVDGSGSVDSVAATSVVLQTNTWYQWVCWHDAVRNKVGVQINNGTVFTKNWSEGIDPGVSTFVMGNQSIAARPLDGKLDSVSIWRRVLTDVERRIHFYNGVGKDCCPYVNYP